MIRIQNNFLRQFPSDGRYLVGVSGGRDSVALLDALLHAGYRNLTVCHLNHQLRARASDADERFVKKLATRCDLRFASDAENVRALAKKKELSIETAGREARYNFFAGVAKRARCRTIFLAHHADDVVETFLINLFRGSGTAGLAAMRGVSRRRVNKIELTIVRPLIATWRTEIDHYVRARRLQFREDESNRDLAPLRNRTRHRIIPYLQKIVGRNIRQSIWRAAMIAAEEEAWMETQVPNSIGIELGVATLRDLPAALQRRQILKWLRSHKIGNVGFDVVENVRALIDNGSTISKINLSEDRHVRRRAKKLFITG
jgi:tRNA(Ile)-lysidine synthase